MNAIGDFLGGGEGWDLLEIYIYMFTGCFGDHYEEEEEEEEDDDDECHDKKFFLSK